MRLIQQATDAVNDHGGDPMKNKRLAQLRLSVEEKLTTLKNLDSEILDILTEDTTLGEEAITEEVEQADSIKELAYGAIVAIEEIFQRYPSTPGTLASPGTPRTVDVKLPKLEMHSFDGNVTNGLHSGTPLSQPLTAVHDCQTLTNLITCDLCWRNLLLKLHRG